MQHLLYTRSGLEARCCDNAGVAEAQERMDESMYGEACLPLKLFGMAFIMAVYSALHQQYSSLVLQTARKDFSQTAVSSSSPSPSLPIILSNYSWRYRYTYSEAAFSTAKARWSFHRLVSE